MNSHRQRHSWNVTPGQAIAIQQRLRSEVVFEKLEKPIHLIAGCDISFDKSSDVVYAGVVVLRIPELIEVSRGTAITKATFPYIPGLLSFRESPAVLEAWKQLQTVPDVLMVDGQGFAHPRRFGIASHLGLLLDIPTIGCAKSRLIGTYQEPGRAASSFADLLDCGEVVGVVLRTADNVKPVFVSVGHRVTLDDARRVIMQCSRGHRIPESTRQAHLLVTALRRAAGSPSVRTGNFVLNLI